MANEQSGSPLRRWRPFYGAFGAIDDAIEAAAGGGHPRAAFRDARARIVRLLRGAADDDDAAVAEQLCAALDDAMVEALATLRVVPVPHGVLVSTDLAMAVGTLGNHGSARIRSLADEVARRWKTTAHVATAATSVKEEQQELPLHSVDRIPRHGIPVNKVVSKMEAKKPIAAEIERQMEAKKLIVVTQRDKMETTKRKLREGYEEAWKVKRQHTVKKIDDKEAPKLWERSQRKMHRGPARCRIISSGVRRSLLPSLQLI